MILVVGNTKGGVGKTTLAVNLTIMRALAGRDVLLVDGDEQGTALSFTELRTSLCEDAGYTAVGLQGGAVRTEVRKLAPKYDDVIIDVGGRDTGSLRAALTIADRALIPVQPRSFDVWSVGVMAELVAEARVINERLQAFSFLNAADAQGHDNEEAAQVLEETNGITHLPQLIVRRKAFPNAAAMGKSILEHPQKDAKAVAELEAVVQVIFP